MNTKKFMGMFTAAIMPIGLMIWGCNFSYAEEETHKHSEKALAPEHPTVELPMCPTCKDVRVSPEKGRTLAAQVMVCPDCKNEIGELAVHHCDKCEKDVLACPICKREEGKAKK